MALFEHIQKYVPPPLIYLGGIALLWYQVAYALTTDADVVATVYSPLFRYGVAFTISGLILLELRSRKANFFALLRGRDGLLSLLAVVCALLLVSVVVGMTLDLALYVRTRKVSSTPLPVEFVASGENRNVKCIVDAGGEHTVVCLPYGWMQTNHYDIDRTKIKVVNDAIDLPLGNYRFAAISNSEPDLFDEQDVVIDAITPSDITLRFEIPSREQVTNIVAGMVRIDQGVFRRGCGEDVPHAADRKPEVDVFLSAYYIDKYECNVEQYTGFVGAVNDSPPDFIYPDRNQIQAMGAKKPIVGLNWYDASNYARFRRKRLPTEAEWEKAARSGKDNIYPWGNEFSEDRFVPVRKYDAPEIRGERWYNVLGKLLLVDVDSGANQNDVTEQGVVGMSGNALEWCFDLYRCNYNTSETSEILGMLRVVRGSVINVEAGLPGKVSARGDYRGYGHPSKAYNNVGVRCVRSESYQWAIDSVQ